MVNYSVKSKLSSRIKSDGHSLIYLQVLINRKKHEIGLNISWSPEFWNDKNGLCKAQSKSDKDFNDYNIIIRDAMARVNEVFKIYRLSNHILDIKSFKKEYYNTGSRTDFVKYYQHKLDSRAKRSVFNKSTLKSHRSTLKKLKEFTAAVYFYELNHNFADDFDFFLQSKYGNSHNTRWGHHKTIKSYLVQAKKDNIHFTNPYNNFKISLIQSNWKAISKVDLKLLMNHYQSIGKKHMHSFVLRRFLFSCFTGLRLSDLKRMNKATILDDMIILKMYKSRKLNKKLIMPLNEHSTRLLSEEKEFNDKSILFNYCTDQYSNRVITNIGYKLGITQKLHHHIARETFATLYLEAGGSLEMLKEYLGHSDITTTMKYVHISKERKQNDIMLMNTLLD